MKLIEITSIDEIREELREDCFEQSEYQEWKQQDNAQRYREWKSECH